MERDGTLDGVEEDPLPEIHSHAVTYFVATDAQKDSKVICPQTITPHSGESPLNGRVADCHIC